MPGITKKKAAKEVVEEVEVASGWGLFDDADSLKGRNKAFWGARAVAERLRFDRHGNVKYHLAFFGNRICHYGTHTDVVKLSKYVQSSLKSMEKFLSETGFSSSRVFEAFKNGMEIKAATRNSDGYLYIQAAMPKEQADAPKLKKYHARRHFDACVGFEVEASSYEEACRKAEKIAETVSDEEILASVQPGEIDVEEAT